MLIVQRSNSSLLTTMFQQFSLPREALNMQSKFLKDSRMKVGKKSLKSFQEKAWIFSICETRCNIVLTFLFRNVFKQKMQFKFVEQSNLRKKCPGWVDCWRKSELVWYVKNLKTWKHWDDVKCTYSLWNCDTFCSGKLCCALTHKWQCLAALRAI